MALSNIFIILRNPFYCGLMEYPKKSGKWYVGQHEPCISQELFKKVQEKLDSHKASGGTHKEFAFTRLMKCGLCNSGITAEEKFKSLADGSTAKYIYYSCTKFYDKQCKNTYLREEELIRQLVEIIDKIDLDKIGVKKKLEKELERMSKFRGNVLGLSDEEIEVQKKTDIRTYAKYLLKEGTLEEKRELMQSFKSRISLINKKIITDN